MGAENPSGSVSPRVEELTEVYGECTAFVSANDIDSIRGELPPEDFAELSARLGWDETIEAGLGGVNAA